jgi:hypothetical protein
LEESSDMAIYEIRDGHVIAHTTLKSNVDATLT